MSNSIFQNILRITEGSRSSAAKKNILLLFIFSGFNFIFNILLVRFTLKYLGQENYGIWLTIASVLTWFGYLDFGLGNGLRNKLAEALAKKDYRLAKIYVSTTYALFTAILFTLYLIFYFIHGRINWAAVFNTPPRLQHELSLLVMDVFIFFMINFVLKLISFIVMADQKPAINGFFNFLSNFATVLVVYLLLQYAAPSLFLLGVLSAVVPVVIFLGASLVLFYTKYRSIAPSFRHIDVGYSKDLIGLGFKFFIIQASGLIVFATDNMIITQLYGPDQVTIYNVAFKYFNYIPVVFFVILTPLWSAYTDAYVKEDFAWIKNAMKKILGIWALLSLFVIFMVVIANTVYDIWLESRITVPNLLTVLMGVFAVVTNWNNIFAYFLNGVGKIRLQLYSSVFIAIVNIPLSIWFAKYLNFGISGIIMGTITCLLLGTIWAPVQYYKIINRKDHGIWGK